NTPVTVVTSYFNLNAPVEFIKDPTAIKWNKEGWKVWYGPGRADAFLSSLFAIDGNRAYLIYSSQNFTWNVPGSVALEAVRWKGDSFNLTGFCLDEQSPPTFDKFFSASAAHRACRIYRL